jgi:uncharacterized membrane protein
MPETISESTASAAEVSASIEPVAAVAEIPVDATIPTSAPNSAVDMTVPGDEKILAILGYIGFLCVLPLALKPKSEMCQHHGKQALAVTIMFFIASAVVFNIGFLFWIKQLLIFSVIINAIWGVVSVLGIMGAAAGKKNKLPFFGGVAKRFNW